MKTTQFENHKRVHHEAKLEWANKKEGLFSSKSYINNINNDNDEMQHAGVMASCIMAGGGIRVDGMSRLT